MCSGGRTDTEAGGCAPPRRQPIPSMLVRCRFLFVRLVACASVLAATVEVAVAQAAQQVPLKPLSQYHQESWQTRDGLPTNGIRALAQDADGFLWLGTEEGLVRFDGEAFRTFDRNSTPALTATDELCLL